MRDSMVLSLLYLNRQKAEDHTMAWKDIESTMETVALHLDIST